MTVVTVPLTPNFSWLCSPSGTLKFPAVKLCGLPHPPTQILVADGLDFLLVSSVGELVDQSNVTIRGLHFLSCTGFLGWEHKLGNKSTIITGVIRTQCASLIAFTSYCKAEVN